MALTDPIQVQGLKELQRGIKQVDRDMAKELRKAFNEVAGVVVDDIRRLVPVESGAARNSVRAASTQSAAAIKVGGRRAPHYPWLDFGGKVGINRSVTRPFIPGGRYLYPSIKRNRAVMLDALDDALDALFRKAGWDGR